MAARASPLSLDRYTDARALPRCNCCRVRLCRFHFRELAVLLEFVHRPPQLYRDDPVAFEAAAAVAACLAAQTDAAAFGQPAPGISAAAAAAAGVNPTALTGELLRQTASCKPGSQQQLPCSSVTGSAGAASCATAVAAAAALSSEGDVNLPWEQDPMRLLVEALCRQGTQTQAALLHHSIALLAAGARALLTQLKHVRAS